MKITVTNTHVKPIYWAHQRPWPFNQPVEVDVNEVELAQIKRDTRLAIGKIVAEEIIDASGSDINEQSEDKPGTRSRKAK